MIRRRMLSPVFLVYFIRSAFFFRYIIFIMFYILMPLDLIPEKVFGVIGFLDDLFFIFFFLVFVLSLAAVAFMRRR